MKPSSIFKCLLILNFTILVTLNVTIFVSIDLFFINAQNLFSDDDAYN